MGSRRAIGGRCGALFSFLLGRGSGTMLHFKSLILKPIAIKGMGSGFPASKGIRRGCHSINFLSDSRVKTSFEVGKKTDRIPSCVAFIFFKVNDVIINRSASLSDFGKFQLSSLLFVDVTKRSMHVSGKSCPGRESGSDIYVKFTFGPSNSQSSLHIRKGIDDSFLIGGSVYLGREVEGALVEEVL